jgi:RHS repeat-associated protein
MVERPRGARGPRRRTGRGRAAARAVRGFRRLPRHARGPAGDPRLADGRDDRATAGKRTMGGGAGGADRSHAGRSKTRQEGSGKSVTVTVIQYTGKIWLSELSLYYYKARLYSPTLGRFLQVDPIGYEGGINLYDYVDDDPTNSVDASGLFDCGPKMDDPCGRERGFVPVAFDQASSSSGSLRGRIQQGLQNAMEGVETGVTITAKTLAKVPSTIEKALTKSFWATADPFIRLGSRQDWVKVGRWMGPAEANAMFKSRHVQESRSGLTHVAYPANPDTFRRSAAPGSVYVEFMVPASSLRNSGTGTASIPGPRSIFSRKETLHGRPPFQMPRATSIHIREVK